jgi:hypothetical protein
MKPVGAQAAGGEEDVTFNSGELRQRTVTPRGPSGCASLEFSRIRLHQPTSLGESSQDVARSPHHYALEGCVGHVNVRQQGDQVRDPTAAPQIRCINSDSQAQTPTNDAARERRLLAQRRTRDNATHPRQRRHPILCGLMRSDTKSAAWRDRTIGGPLSITRGIGATKGLGARCVELLASSVILSPA